MLDRGIALGRGLAVFDADPKSDAELFYVRTAGLVESARRSVTRRYRTSIFLEFIVQRF